MTIVPTPPIFVICREDGDVLAFETVTKAAGYIEPPEVDEDAYRIFDALAHEALPVVSKWDVEISSWSEDVRLTELRTVLLGFLSASGAEVQDDWSLDDVVRAAAEVAYSAERDRTWPRFVPRVVAWFRRRRTNR